MSTGDLVLRAWATPTTARGARTRRRTRDVVAPQRLHREHVFSRRYRAAASWQHRGLDLVFVPAESDTEHEPPAESWSSVATSLP
jgi:hypothetical protein